MIPLNPDDNNLNIAREFVAKVGRAMHFQYSDLVTSPVECLASATTLTHGWMSTDVPCGAIVLLSMDEVRFNKIKDDLDKFFDWVKKLIKSIADEFLREHQQFDFVEAASDSSNQFVQWLRENLPDQSTKALHKLVEILLSFKFYAGDMFDVPGNPMRPMLDATLNHQVGDNLSLRTVLEAIGVKFHD